MSDSHPATTAALRDEMFDFARQRLREEPSHTRRTALVALLEETIRPFTSADTEQGRMARHALRLFVAQWSTHPDYSEEWGL